MKVYSDLMGSIQDEYRLPEGMKRVGYDADTGRYYFQDTDGSYWRGPEGAEFGEMERGVSDKLPATGVKLTSTLNYSPRRVSP